MTGSIVGSIRLRPEKVIVKKAERNRTQILFVDILHISLFADTAELLVYLESLTEQVRLIDSDQNAKEL